MPFQKCVLFPRTGAVRWIALAGLLTSGIAGPAAAEQAGPRRLTLADALELAERQGYDFLLADAAMGGAEGDLMAARGLANPLFAGSLVRSTGVPLGQATTSAHGYSLSLADFLHPYHGNLYFNSARANSYGFWESIPFAAGASLFWEYFLENEQVDYSDVVPTTLSGPVQGEVLFRVSQMILDNTASGKERLFREVAAAVLNPAGSLARLVRGEARRDFSNPDDRFPSRFALTVMAGYRHVSRGSSDAEHRDQAFVAAALRYGDPFEGGLSKPFDVFEAAVEVVSPAEAVINRLSERGLVALGEVGSSTTSQHRLGVFMSYEYRNDGLQTFWESGFSGSLMSRFPVSARAEVRTEAGLRAFPLSALQTDYPMQDLAETGRTYDYGPGGGPRVAVALRRRGIDLLSASYEAIWIRTTNGVSRNSAVQFARIEAKCPITESFSIGSSWDWDRRITSYDQNLTVRTSHIQWRFFGALTFRERL